jgi:integrase
LQRARKAIDQPTIAATPAGRFDPVSGALPFVVATSERAGAGGLQRRARNYSLDRAVNRRPALSSHTGPVERRSNDTGGQLVEGMSDAERAALNQRRAPGNTCVTALRAERAGTFEESLNARAAARSCGPRRLASGLRIGECAALDVDDIGVSARKGRVVVREGKGDAYREVPLNAEARDALDAWTGVRRRQLEGSEEPDAAAPSAHASSRGAIPIDDTC